MNISAKQFLVILFLNILITNDVKAILSEEQKEAFSVEQLRALMVNIAPVTLTALISAIILGLVVRSKNKTIAQQNETILEQNKTIENQNGTMSKIEQLKTLVQNFLSKTVDDCSDEKGLNADTAFAYIHNNRVFLNIVFSVLDVEDKTFITNFGQLMSAVEGEYMKTSAAYESLKYGKKRLEEKNQVLLQEIKENRREIDELKKKVTALRGLTFDSNEFHKQFKGFVFNSDEYYNFSESFITGSPVTYDLMYLIYSKTFQNYNELLSIEG